MTIDSEGTTLECLWEALAIAGFALLIVGYGIARETPLVLYSPPTWMRHVALLLLVPLAQVVGLPRSAGAAVTGRG